MKSESFPGDVSDRFLAVWLVASLAFALATGMTFISYVTWDFGRSFVLALLLLALAAIAWRNRKRPVLEITDEELRWAPIFWWNPQRVPLREIERLDVQSKTKIIIRRRTGRSVAVRLKRIDARHREHAFNLLNQLEPRASTRE